MAESDNKKIAKNTLYMYFRMFLVMGVTLFTSRVVLQQLGVDDYGIYSVLGGLVTLFTFLNQAMATSTQRFITYELGKGDGNVSSVFTACMKIHIWMAAGIVLLAETVGLWFVNAKMSFPPESMTAVNWTYQLSILNCVFGVFKIPYNALVLAHEKMSFYAYNSIIEVLLKLAVVFLLVLAPSDKLVVYMALLASISLLMTIWYMVFCKRQFPTVKFIELKDKKYYREILSFSGWATFGSFANVGFQQGIAVIINIYYGIAVNAAIGIATQVNAAISQFVGGFQAALNPQLIKSEAANDSQRQTSLILASSKFSFFIMLLVAFPLLCNLGYLLDIWLTNYPEKTQTITSLIVLGALLETLSGPLWVTIFATGKIRSYQIIVSLVLLLNLPIAVILGELCMPVWMIFATRILLFYLALCVRLWFLKRLIGFSPKLFLRKVFIPIGVTCILLGGLLIVFRFYVMPAQSFVQFAWQTLLSFAITLVLIIAFGLTKTEYTNIKTYTLKRFKR